MCLRSEPALCERVRRQLYFLALPDPSPKKLELLAPQWLATRQPCLCDFSHAKQRPRAGPTGVVETPPRRNVFENPQSLRSVFEFMGNDVRSLLVLLGVNSISRAWAVSMLSRPRWLQATRALVIDCISSYKLKCLRRVLAVLASVHVPSSHNDTSSTTLFDEVFPRLPSRGLVTATLDSKTGMDRVALSLSQDIPRLCPGEFGLDRDVLYSMACRQRDTSDLAKLLLIRDRANPETAALKTGRSPLADLLESYQDNSPEWRSGGQHFLPLDITWMFARGFKLQPEDVTAMRRTGRTEIWEGSLRMATACNRGYDVELLLDGASPFERERAQQIVLEERRACEQFRGRDSIFGIPTSWKGNRRARSKSDFCGVSEGPPEPQEPAERRSSLAEATEEMLNKAAAKSRKWAHVLHR